ncbi:ribonuclease MC-like [Carcharodon carcharias]|uniref:ribonuclease MC-like n=1 Tax=Carcharodon carcharias TaxID=13397 RepID=UPI001B7E39EB|nr:ribonuclease MC-like [Carcharodon carcharias]
MSPREKGWLSYRLVVSTLWMAVSIFNWTESSADPLLAVQWPPIVCKVKNWTSKACKQNNWTIHGYWPSQRCQGKSYDPSVMNPLKRKLNVIWPNLSGKPNDKFWQSEWNKHGECLKLHLSQCDYFKKAISIYDRVFKNCSRTKPWVELEKCLKQDNFTITGPMKDGEIKINVKNYRI